MNLKQLNQFDTALETCSTKEVNLSLDRQGWAVMDSQMLVEILVPLIQYPGLISYLEEDISDEICQLGYFNLEAGSVTSAGRDFLSSHQ